MSGHVDDATDADIAVAVFPEQFPPIFSLTSNKLPDGFGIDMMEAITERADLRIRYQPTRTWDEAMARLQAGDADLVPNVGITPERSRYLEFSRPISRFDVSVFVRRGTDHVRGPADLDRAEAGVAVVERNVAVSALADRPGVATRMYSSVNDAFFALLTGEVDALVYPRPVIERLADAAGSGDRIRAVGPPVVTIERAVGVRKGRPELLARIDSAIEQLKGTEEYERIQARWYGPVEPYWSARRLTYVFGSVLAVLLAVALYWRFHTLRRANRRLTDATAFNRAVLDAAREGVVTTDPGGTIRAVNRGAETLFGYRAADLVGRPLDRIVRNGDEITDIPRDPPADDGGNDGEARAPLHEATGIRRDGSRLPVQVGAARARAAGETLHVYTLYDLSEQRAAEQEATFLADHDPLTSLLNPRGSVLVLENLLEQARRHERAITCLHIGLLHFGQINSLYGRALGDRLLVRVARLIEANLRTSDSVGRSDGGILTRPEGAGFMLVLPETDADGTRELGRRLRELLTSGAFEVEDHRIHLQVKMGIASFPDHADSATELLSYAHAALSEAKTDSSRDICVFTSETKTRETNEQLWLERIHDALRNDRFELHFQPILHIASGAIRHYEVLVRMRADDGSLALPGDFIEVAERHGAIVDIDNRVLERAFDWLEASADDGDPVTLNVNLSAAYVGDHDLYDWLERRLQDHRLDPRRLVFEVTETAAIRNVVRASSFMEKLKALGCRFALDDFGTGFSSFSYLRTLPVDIIKIDGSFVRHLTRNPADQALVQSVTRIAHSLSKTVIAEHVEDAESLELLRGYGVDYAQGFHIGRPAPGLDPAGADSGSPSQAR